VRYRILTASVRFDFEQPNLYRSKFAAVCRGVARRHRMTHQRFAPLSHKSAASGNPTR
jgi:hypothetical protein